MTASLAAEVRPLLNTVPAARSKLVACLLIVLPYNLFHGNKWLYRLEGQQLNFEHATQVLHAVIALDDASKGISASG